MGWVWVSSWTVRVTIQIPSTSSAIVNEIHRCIATFWVQISIILLFLFYTTLLFPEPIVFVMFMRSIALLHVVFWSWSIQPLRIDVQAWYCHLLTIYHSCGISILILPWRIILLCERYRMWCCTQIQINSSVLATMTVWPLFPPLQLSPDTLHLIYCKLWVCFCKAGNDSDSLFHTFAGSLYSHHRHKWHLLDS